MKRVLLGLDAACVLAACIFGIVLVGRVLQEQAAMRRFIAAGPANLAREEASALREGIPLTAGQLQRSLPPPSQNAAPLYTKLTKLLHDKPLGLPKYAEGMDAFHTYTPQQVASVRKTLAARQDVMTLVHQAADRQRCVFARDWSKGSGIAFPEYRALLASAWLLKTESYLLARDGHYQEAAINQARGFHVAEHAASDPVLIEYLIGVACESRTLSGMQSILTLSGPDTDADTCVSQAVIANAKRPSLRFAMAGETGFVCFSFVRMHQAEQYGVQEVMRVGGLSTDKSVAKNPVPPAEQRRVHDLIDVWQADFLARMRQIVRSCDAPFAERRRVFAAAGEQGELTHPAESVNLASRVILPVYSLIDQNDTRTQARAAVTLAAAALLAEKAKTSAYPAAPPSDFTDPYTDKPLLYRREGGGGFVVYSAGPTGHFDGGKPGAKAPGQESLFRFPVVPVPN